MTAIDDMPDLWWDAFVEECSCGVAGDACAQLHAAVGKAEIARLVAAHRDLSSQWVAS